MAAGAVDAELAALTTAYVLVMAILGPLAAGVIGVGGRVIDATPPAKFSFAHYGFAGEIDFNNSDMRQIDVGLRLQPATQILRRRGESLL